MNCKLPERNGATLYVGCGLLQQIKDDLTPENATVAE